MMKRRASLLIVAVLLLLVVFLILRNPPKSGESAGKTVSAVQSIPPAMAEFRDWAESRKSGTIGAADLQAGIRLAAERKAEMLRLIEENPEGAIANAVSWSEYAALPEEIKAMVERPFSTTGELRVLPVCDEHANHEETREIEIDGVTHEAFVYGGRLGQGSKHAAPVCGIVLDTRAALADEVIRIADEADQKELAGLPLGNRDATRDFATGQPLGPNPVTSIAGGKRYLFNDAGSIAATNEKLAELDAKPGPKGGSRLAFELADGDGGIPWNDVYPLANELASAWTETNKSTFFIRVDFSDAANSVSQATLSNVINTTVASSITQMSYGKTTVSASVSSMMVRMPQPKAYYLSAGTDAIFNDAKAAYETLAGVESLSSYDIIGVHFPSIGMQSGGVTFAGLATVGGSRHWLQGSTNSGVIIHEFGHNYGLGHASFWDTSDGSVVGTGASVEYGDIFDIMGDGPDPEGHFHMQGKQYLNWITSSQWTNANTAGSGTFRIYPFDNSATTSTRRGVRVNKASGEYYWIGYRPGITDAPLLKSGAYLLWQRSGYNRCWLLDTTPVSSSDRDDAAISMGRTYSDTTAGVHITPTAKGGSGAEAWLDVNIQLGNFPGNVAPTASIGGPTTANARSSVTFTATAADGNGDTLAYSWDFGDGAVSTNTNSVNHSWMIGGTYNISLTVTDMKGGTITANKSVTVTDPLSTWTQRTSGTTAHLKDIVYGGGKLLAVGSAKGTWCSSTNGTSWNTGTIWVSGNTAYNMTAESIIHDGGQFVVAGYDYDFGIDGWIGVIYTSPNGTTWTRRHNTAAGELNDIAHGGGVYVAVGDNGTIWRSTNSAVTWSPISSGLTQHLRGVAWDGSKFVAVGSFGNGSSGVVLTSTDGSTWTDKSTGAGLASWHGFYQADFCNDRILASGWYTRIRRSTDHGNTFVTNDSVNWDISAFSYGNGVYLASGVNLDDADADANLLSTDGENWTPLTTADQDDRNGAVFFNNTFITVGDNGAIWQSDAFTAPVQGGYAAWVAVEFPGSPPLSGADDDFDGDGVPNLGEYATGTDPKDPLDHANLAGAISGDHFTLTVPKAAGVTDVDFLVEYSSTLQSWSPVGTTVVEDSATQLVVRITATVSSGVPPKGFLRVRFTNGN